VRTPTITRSLGGNLGREVLRTRIKGGISTLTFRNPPSWAARKYAGCFFMMGVPGKNSACRPPIWSRTFSGINLAIGEAASARMPYAFWNSFYLTCWPMPRNMWSNGEAAVVDPQRDCGHLSERRPTSTTSKSGTIFRNSCARRLVSGHKEWGAHGRENLYRARGNAESRMCRCPSA